MKRRITLLFILCMIILVACGKRPEAATLVTASPWPSHAPGATPYIRLQTEAGGMPNPETHQGPVEYSESYEDFIRSIELPQDEPYPFVVRTNAMLQGADTLDDHIALAEKYSELGCEAKVKEMHSVEDGKEHTAWVTIITTTPSHFWEISGSLSEKLHVEQLYKSVDIRFDTVVWPEG